MAAGAVTVAGGNALISAAAGIGVETVVAAATGGILLGTGVILVVAGVALAGYYVYQVVNATSTTPVCGTDNVSSCPNPN